MQYRTINWEVLPNPLRPEEKTIGLLTLNRPEHLNAVDVTMRAELDVLLEVKRTGYFDPKADDDIALIVSRRILRYPDGRRRFVVHPAMAPLLESRREAA